MVLENVLVFMSYVRFLNDASRIDKYVCSISIKVTDNLQVKFVEYI